VPHQLNSPGQAEGGDLSLQGTPVLTVPHQPEARAGRPHLSQRRDRHIRSALAAEATHAHQERLR
jgi:hypothetical protein